MDAFDGHDGAGDRGRETTERDGRRDATGTRRRVDSLARLLDSAVRIPGTSFRVGIDPLLGLLPGAGDVLAAGLSGYIVYAGARLGVPRATLARMVLNVLVDALVGSLPLVGDLFDAGWKANRRNAELLERAHDPDAARRDRWVVAGAVGALVLGLLAVSAAVLLAVAWLVSRLGALA